MEQANTLENAPLGLLLGTANDIVDDIVSTTRAFDAEREATYPRLDVNEVATGRVLGRGGFCVVHEIKSINLEPTGRGAQHREDEQDEMRTRRFLSAYAMRDGDARYAIKRLSEECRQDNSRLLKGTIDLAIEAKFLAVIEHPHIIKMRAISSSGLFHKHSFIVLDRLYDTLEHRVFQKWKKQKRSLLFCCGRGQQKKLLSTRINIAHDIATAMRYLHSQNIIYRDLKPDNIGFDVRGDVKIFDFGLAKELKPAEAVANGTYKMTGFTGSMRYMAPEVSTSKPYNLSADMYSFTVLFWLMIELETPFRNYNASMHEEFIVKQGFRPPIPTTISHDLAKMMGRGWAPKPGDRPSFDEVCGILAEEAEKLDPEAELGEVDASQRSAVRFSSN